MSYACKIAHLSIYCCEYCVIICPCLWCSAEDEEDTIAAQEVVEGEADHAGELDDLAKEGNPHY